MKMRLAENARFLLQVVSLFAALLFPVFSAMDMPMAPFSPSQAEFVPHQEVVIAEHTIVHFAARAPPLTGPNVACTGAAVAEHGNGIVMHGHAIHVASLAFGVGLDAPNNGAIPDSWRPISGVGAQVNTPSGFTSYRTADGDIVHVSPSGLQYGADPKFGNRVDHVLDHTAPNPNKPVHSVFNAQGDDALALVDEAWIRRGAPDPNDPAAFVVNMGRPVGTAGETSIRVVVKPGTNEIITAYPY